MILSRRAHDDILAHGREAVPAECCGLLLGSAELVAEAARTRNLSTDPNRFEIDPGDHIRMRRSARARSLDVVGFYHSHPRSEAAPSASDRAEAAYPGYVYAIVSLRAEPAELRMYRLENGEFQELPWILEC